MKPNNKKTRDQIEALKRDWKSDPIWDIEETEGFENYHDELKAYRLQCEEKWEKKALKQTEYRAKKLNCSVEVVLHMDFLEQRIDELEELITNYFLKQ